MVNGSRASKTVGMPSPHGLHLPSRTGSALRNAVRPIPTADAEVCQCVRVIRGGDPQRVDWGPLPHPLNPAAVIHTHPAADTVRVWPAPLARAFY